MHRGVLNYFVAHTMAYTMEDDEGCAMEHDDFIFVTLIVGSIEARSEHYLDGCLWQRVPWRRYRVAQGAS